MKGERRERWLQTLAFFGVLALLGLALFSALIVQRKEEEKPAGPSSTPTSTPIPTSPPLLPPPIVRQITPGLRMPPYPEPGASLPSFEGEIYQVPEPSGILDPALAEDTTIPRLLFLGLTLWDEKAQEVVPILAESWEVSADGLVYTFHLRRGIPWVRCFPGSGVDTYYFQREVAAADVVFAIERALRPETGAPHADLLYPLVGARERAQGDETTPLGVVALDEATLRFTLTAPFPDFPRLLAHPVAWPVPREVLSQHGEKWTEPGIVWVSGAFCPMEWQPGREITLRPNPFLVDPDIRSHLALPVQRKPTPAPSYPRPTP